MESIVNTARGGVGLRTRIIRVHTAALFVLGTALGFGAIAGGLWGGGMYPFLVTNHIAAVGLLQAYFLMALIALAVWIATLTTRNTGANGAGFAINYLNSDEIKKMSIPASPPTIVPLMRMN